MRSLHHVRWLLWLIPTLGFGSLPALAADPCAGFAWDVTKERALFGAAPQSLPAGKDIESAAALMPDRLYELQLSLQSQVTFPVDPGKKSLTDGAYAGLAVFRIAAPGTYRIALDAPFWVDVVSDGQLVRSKDFQGAQGCHAPHKIVEFDLSGAPPFTLQFSGARSATARVSITLAPASKF
jgi:hypothetical protein